MRMSAERERCRLCGSPVEVVSSDEGTSYYRPAEQGDVEALEIARTLVAEGRGYGTWENRLAEALIACSAALERVEQERDEQFQSMRLVIDSQIARAEKAEKDRDHFARKLRSL